MIDFEWYRSFISIYKHRSVSAAAKSRILTQPAMSQHLAALEAEIGESLFVRAPRKMVPTNKGKDLYTKLVPLMESLENMTNELVHHSYTKDLVPLVRLGSPAEYFTKRAITEIKSLDVRYIVEFGIAPKLLDSLENDELDLVLTTKKSHHPGIEFTKIENETFVVVAPSDYERGDIQSDEMEAWLASQKWLSYGIELPIIRRYWREKFKKRPSLKAYHVIPDLRAILEAVENGMGISILPTYLIEESVKKNKSKILFPDLSVENTIYAAYKIDEKLNPTIQKILSAINK